MAYNNYFPATYQPINPYALQQIQQPQQIQNGGLVTVRSRAEAQNYPVAPGNSVTFKDETAPFVYTKTMGFSQLDRPVFEVFRLIREGMPQEQKPAESTDIVTEYATRQELDTLKAELEALRGEFVNFKADLPPKNVKGKKTDE